MSDARVSIDEQMVWAMAVQARPDDVIVVGVATPMAVAAALLARELVSPSITVITAATVEPAPHDIAQPMIETGMLDRIGVTTLAQAEILDQIQRGRVSLQFISPAQVDGTGRLNTSRIAADGGWRRLPGGLATADIAVLIGRLVAYRAVHRRRFLPDRVDFVTGAGHELDDDVRRTRRLPGSGVTAIVTDEAVLEWGPGGFGVVSAHGRGTASSIAEGCGFDVRVPDVLEATPPPPREALELLRTVIDPHGIRRLEVRSTRAAALEALARLRT